MADPRDTPEERLLALRRRADEDYVAPPLEREAGRHSVDVTELGLRVSITRSRYPNRPDGRDLYAVTISRILVDGPPDEGAVQHALTAAFGVGAAIAQARPGGPAVRMYRIPADAMPV